MPLRFSKSRIFLKLSAENDWSNIAIHFLSAFLAKTNLQYSQFGLALGISCLRQETASRNIFLAESIFVSILIGSTLNCIIPFSNTSTGQKYRRYAIPFVLNPLESRIKQ